MHFLRSSLLGGILLITSGSALAQTTDAAVAQALFDDGKHLMQAGNYAEACPKLVESQRLDPGGGTLIAIALCHEAEGKTASAWGDFSLASSEARREHRPEREALAAQHIKGLEARLVRVRVVTDARPPGLQIQRGEELVGAAQWGTAVPIDPGTYRFTATAPGKAPWTVTVDLSGDGKTVEVRVPALADAPVPVAPVPVPSVAPVVPAPPPRPAAPPPSERSGWAYVPGGVGVVSIGVASALGVAASNKWSDSKTACPGLRCTTPAAQALSGQASHLADASTGLFVVGAAGVVASVVWLLWPRGSARTAAVQVSPMIGGAGGVYGLALEGSL